jgi:hypothetical protein
MMFSETPSAHTMPKDVWTMVGTSTVEAAIVCLGSLHRFCSDSFTLHILSDGTLTDEQKQRLNELPRTKVADDFDLRTKVAARLAPFPLLEKTYRENVYLKKLIDIPILAGQSCCFIDSDILFFRPISGLFEERPQHGRIAEDRSVTPGARDLFNFQGRLHGYLNCGFIDAEFPSLEDAEMVLGRWRDTKSNVVEQLIWAVSKRNAALEYVTLDSIYIPRPHEPLASFQPSKSHFAIHLTSWRKKHAAELQAALSVHSSNATSKVKFVRRTPPLFWWLLGLKVIRRLTKAA